MAGGTLAGLIGADVNSVSLTGNFATPNAGQNISLLLGLTGNSAFDYMIASPPQVTANIAPAPLVATASPASLSVGGTPPALGGSFSGFVDGQTLASLLAAGYRQFWTTAADGSSAAGHYAIFGAFNDGNYSVTQAAGNAGALIASVAAPLSPNTSGGLLATIGGGAQLSGATQPGGVGAPGGTATFGTAAAPGSGIVAGDAGTSTAPMNDSVNAGSAGTPGGGSGADPNSADRSTSGSTDRHESNLGGRRLLVIDGGVNSARTARAAPTGLAE